MTVHPDWIAADENPDKQTLLTPLRPVRYRTSEVIDRISAEIAGGRLKPGARLPTEAEMMRAMGVSRTVVREAVSALRASGLVITRQGAGAFVAPDQAQASFRISPEGKSSIADIVGVMELRVAVEIEAAALAAERVTRPSLGKFNERSMTSIAPSGKATQRSRGFRVPPRDRRSDRQSELCGAAALSRPPRHPSTKRARASRLRPSGKLLSDADSEQHRRIAAAIRARDAAAARRSMRSHLGNSLARYRHLANQAALPLQASTRGRDTE